MVLTMMMMVYAVGYAEDFLTMTLIISIMVATLITAIAIATIITNTNTNTTLRRPRLRTHELEPDQRRPF